MCGINGILKLNKEIQIDMRKTVQLMNSKIIHRGPDSEGFFEEDVLCMGMRRLSIIDIKGGNQPVFNEDRSVVVVFNGEIYNFQKLRNELVQKGHFFHTRTDTEIIVHIYEEYGTQGFDKMDGMFAFSLYDRKRKKLYLVRDRIGEKPCYYTKTKDFIIWGSELKSLVATDLFPKSICKKALNQYFQLSYIPSPLSIFEGVYKLNPGTFLEIDDYGNIKAEQYWKLKIYENKNISYESAKRHLQYLVEKSVKERLVSDVPVGAFLSGGIDSSSIVAMISKQNDKKIHTFTIGFDEKEYDESYQAKRIAKLYGTKHTERKLDYNTCFTLMETILSGLDEPFADVSVLPTYFVSQCAAKQVKVILTGDAGDEIFAGYNKYLIHYYCQKYMKIPSIIRNKVIEPLFCKIPDKSVLTRKLRKVMNASKENLFRQRVQMVCQAFKPEEMKMLLKDEFYVEDSLAFLEEYYNTFPEADEFLKTQYMDLKVCLEGDMLAKVDRMAMMNSIETRTPLLAREVVEFAFTMPVEFKIKGKKLKRIYKDMVKPLLPSRFEKNAKKGFDVPMDIWMRNGMREQIMKALDPVKIESQGIFNCQYISGIIEEHMNCKINRKKELWSLYCFEKWYEQYISV